MTELRERVARIIVREIGDVLGDAAAARQSEQLADAILDIPEIRAAKIVAEASPEWIEEHFGAELACELHPDYKPVYT